MNVPEAATVSELDLGTALSAVERPLLRERSAKATAGRLRAGRYLVSFPRSALGPGPRRVLRGICAELGAPTDGWAELERHQSAAVSVHLGCEPDPRGPVLKCYLEFPPANRPQPDLVFLALKWRRGGAHAFACYRTRDGLDAQAQHALLDGIVPPGPVRNAIHGFLDQSPQREALRLLEVQEPGSPRRSLDLNLSGCRQKIDDQAPLLARLLDGSEAADAYLRTHADDALGHVAAGIGRDGRPFATLYHGAHRVFGDL